jgi:Spy/CpxP family protein refolding chaperone
MNTAPHSKKTVSWIPRVFAVTAAVGIACAAGVATATSAVAATPATHVAAKAGPAYGHGGGGGGEENQCGNGLLPILNFCN